MSDPTENYVGEQKAAYRRGIVLGLTLAEVAILIIFVLLLLVGVTEWARLAQIESNEGTVAIKKDAATALQKKAELVAKLKENLGLNDTASDEDIRTMIRALQAQTTPEAKSLLEGVKSTLIDIQKASSQVAAGNKTTESLIRDLTADNANKTGQMNYWKGQAAKAGVGTGETPCWVKPDGTIEFLYDVVLSDNGIRMREYRYEHREEARRDLPMPKVDPSETLSKSDFLSRTLPLYQSSLAKNCRFFVVIFDATGTSQKELYKDLLRTVEGHFYKRLDYGPAPF